MKVTKQQQILMQKLFGKHGYKFVWNHDVYSLYVKVIDPNKHAWEKGHKYFVLIAYDGETYLKTAMNIGYWEIKKKISDTFDYMLAKEVM